MRTIILLIHDHPLPLVAIFTIIALMATTFGFGGLRPVRRRSRMRVR